MTTGSDATPAGLPPAQGLYDPAHEHDACGVGFVVDIKGRRSHAIVSQALTVLKNLLHRGACGCEVNTGDGAGILIQMPHRVPGARVRAPGHPLPGPGHYGAGLVFLPGTPSRPPSASAPSRDGPGRGADCPGVAGCSHGLFRGGAERARRSSPGSARSSWAARPEWPTGPPSSASSSSSASGRSTRWDGAGSRERKFFYIPSLSANTLIYKGMLSADQIEGMFPDVTDPLVDSALALVHQRFSTNTFPSWPLAHPYRLIAHNGEINTLRGQHQLDARARGDLPLLGAGGRPREDHAGGGGGRQRLRRLRQRARVPRDGGAAAAAGRAHDDPRGLGRPRRHERGAQGLLRVPRLPHGALGRPRLHRLHRRHRDRRGARPQRAAPLAVLRHQGRHGHHGLRGGRPRHSAERVLLKERLHPGRIFLVDTAQGRIIDDAELKKAYASQHPYGEWLKTHIRPIESLPRAALCARSPTTRPCSSASRRSAIPTRTCASSWARWPPRARSRWAPWAPTPRWPCSPTGHGSSTTTSSSSSPR